MCAAQEPKFSVDAYAAGPNPFNQGGMGSFIGSGISFDFQVYSLKLTNFSWMKPIILQSYNETTTRSSGPVMNNGMAHAGNEVKS
jgi:hypothetical protein